MYTVPLRSPTSDTENVEILISFSQARAHRVSSGLLGRAPAAGARGIRATESFGPTPLGRPKSLRHIELRHDDPAETAARYSDLIASLSYATEGPERSTPTSVIPIASAIRSAGWSPNGHAAAAMGTVHPTYSAAVLAGRGTQHQMSIARRAGNVRCRVRDHLFDLCRLLIRICLQHLPPLDPCAALTAVAPIP